MATGQYDYQMLQQLQSINSILSNIYSLLQTVSSSVSSILSMIEETFPFYTSLFLVLLFFVGTWYIIEHFFPRGGF